MLGTLICGAAGIAILALSIPYPALAIANLTVWIGLNAAATALVRRRNVVYGLAIAAITATLIVALNDGRSGRRRQRTDSCCTACRASGESNTARNSSISSARLAQLLE